MEKGLFIKKAVFFLLFSFFFVYTGVVYTEGTENGNSSGIKENTIKGKLLFQKHNCIACHQVYGLGGFLGPELTTVISQEGKGEAYARAFLRKGTSKMPDLLLSESDIDYLISYLSYIDQTAVTYKKTVDLP